MKIKKYLSAMLLGVAGLCLGFAFGCQEEQQPTPPVDTKYTVAFTAGENFKYKMGEEEFSEKSFEEVSGSTVTFSLVIDDGYISPVVTANDTTVSASNGVYSVTVNSDITITASVSVEPPHALTGAGTQESPFQISNVKDLLRMAEVVNSGSRNFVAAYYSLTGDIDCGGATLNVIGDFRNSYSYFAGNFNGNGHTISNFLISPGVGTEYVGLFGCVQAMPGATNLGVVQNLNLDNFKITAAAEFGSNVCIGSFMGFSAGAHLVACSATNGEISAESGIYFSYVGGAIGIMQSVTVTSGGYATHFYASADYVNTNVKITCSGYVLAAGGIVGFTNSDDGRGAATVVNCYSAGEIWYAMRAGGVVGWLNDYTSVENCYSTGFINADAYFEALPDDNNPDIDYYYAYAGGLVAYTGLNTVISDSFSLCEIEANGNNTYKGDIVAKSVASTAYENEVQIINCHSGAGVQATSAKWVKETLNWNAVDWIITDGSLPVTNMTSTEQTKFTVTLNYGNEKVNGVSTKAIEIEIQQNSYSPFSYYVGTKAAVDAGEADFYEYVISDGKLTSVGYYFDQGCTKKVPFSYVLTNDTVLYVKFADYKPLAKTYYFEGKNGRVIQLELDAEGNYSYVDTQSFRATYIYDGAKIVFADGLFARLGSVEDWANALELEAYFNPAYFIGEVTADGLKIYDGTHFTAENALTFKSAEPTKDGDIFKGVWEKSATLKTNKYEFDGINTWKYTYKGQTTTGKYSVSEGVATLDNGKKASIDASGLLLVDGEYFCLENSFFGTWRAQREATYMHLDGFGSGLAGGAVVVLDGRAYEQLSYVKDGFFNGLSNDASNTYTLLSGYMVFGYFVYNPTTSVISAYFYDSEDENLFIHNDFYLVDDYNGEWIGEGNIGSNAFELIDFNGLGIYTVDGSDPASVGYLVINGERVPYHVSVDNHLAGTFTYPVVGGTTYNLAYNEEKGTVTVSNGSESAELLRRDVMYNMPLVDTADTVYRFNGGGKLTGGGILTETKTDGSVNEYGYKIVSGTVNMDLETPVTDILISVFDKDNASVELGTITVEGFKFVLKLNGQADKELYLYLSFANKDWAVSTFMNTFHIGRFDLSYEATGTFNGTAITANQPYVYFPEYNHIYLFFGNSVDGFTQIYLLLLNDGNMVLSSYPYMVAGDYYYAAPVDEICGAWQNTSNSNLTIEFDGLADSMYTEGTMIDSYYGNLYYYTRRFGKIFMWLYNNEEVAYVVTRYEGDDVGDNIYRIVNGNRYARLKLDECDVLNKPIITAYTEDSIRYDFYFDGTVRFDGKSGQWSIYTADKNFTTLVISVVGEEDVTVLVDHENFSVTIVD